MKYRTVSDINEYHGQSINPMEFPEEMYELYSVPSFDANYPEIVRGRDVGSTKVTVQEGDVLICKINPRINRVWVVKRHTEYPLIASSEWIVIRNDAIDSNYLRWYFSSPYFRMLLNSEVAGIGGSLTRAQPKQVAGYPVPVPDIIIQRCISAILEKISGLISLHRQQIACLDELIKSQFIGMFGDPLDDSTLTKGFPVKMLGDFIALGPQNGLYKPQKYYRIDGAGTPIVRVDSFYNGQVKNYSNLKRLVCTEEEEQLYCLKDNDFVFNRVNGSVEHVGKCALIKGVTENTVFESNVMRVRFDEKAVNVSYLLAYLCSESVRKQLKSKAKVANQASVNQEDIKSLLVPVPTMDEQERFASLVQQSDKSKFAVRRSIEKLETLKAALMQEYFGR